MSRGTTGRGRVTMPVACFVMTTMLPFSAATVDAVSNSSTFEGDVALYQGAAQDAATGQVADPATKDEIVADPAAADRGDEPAPAEEPVAPAATDTATDTASKEALADSTSSVDLAQDEWTDPAPVDPATSVADVDPTTGEWIDPATVKEVEPAPVDAAPVAAAPSVAAASPNSVGVGGGEPWGEPIATAYVAGTGGDGAPCLSAPQWGAETLGVLSEGESVEVRAETMGEWQPVNCAGVGGYVHVALIAWTPVGSPDRVTANGEQPGGKTGGRAVGDQIVNFALQFEGYPYVYAGEGPYAFDCSGFTMFVINNTLGIGVPHDMAVQYQMGRSVDREELQPGDLVFFQNTIHPGMSHDGIYIGGGQFIHAETESSGVRVSDLDSEYYSSRWYGAVRFS
jgi:cell wall-associated NlpC family hydrolase